ncbi:MAG: 16S rRNA (guanine(527)-N(7))-methyltransferase RsmG [Rickettsiales bacterium]|nr:16S rRNA (guanine(527)-N(7))-methyltransferase RsmG [Rickettsiales bacterium]
MGQKNYNDLLAINRNKIDNYIQLLLKWNNRINLIGKSTIDDLWNRHIVDSAQLINFLTDEEIKNAVCADFGSGAGFPGIILSMLGLKHMTLIEKSIQKCNFLREAIKFSDNKIDIINKNIFEVKNQKYDVIFSRALANLNDLLTMVKPFVKSGTRCIFLKGRRVKEEIEEAKRCYSFDFELFDSVTSVDGKVVIISFL